MEKSGSLLGEGDAGWDELVGGISTREPYQKADGCPCQDDGVVAAAIPHVPFAGLIEVRFEAH